MKAVNCGHMEKYISVFVFICVSVSFVFGQPNEDIWAHDIGIKVTEQQASYILSDLSNKNPALAEELRKVWERNREEFFRQIEVYNLFINSRIEITDEEKKLNEEYLKWVEHNFPEELGRLNWIKTHKPDEYEYHVTLSRQQNSIIVETQKFAPKLADAMKKDAMLTKHRGFLLAKIKTSEGSEKERYISKLKKIVDLRFDVIVEKKQIQYEGLEERIAWLQERINEQKAETQKLIDKKQAKTQERLEELLKEVEKLNLEN